MSIEPAVCIIGAGPAGLMAAERLAEAGHKVVMLDRMPSPARKFLLAGRGGLNLTHSEPLDKFLSRYRPASPLLLDAVRAFPPDSARAFSAELGEETFVGSSGRVFPLSFKASPLLRAWLRRLSANGVELRTRHLWRGWSPSGALLFSTPDGDVELKPEATVLALGGASWPRLGSDGGWSDLLRTCGVALVPFAPANVGVRVAWSQVFADRFAGEPLKRISLACGGVGVKGEAMVTRDGLEGGAVYALTRAIRLAITSAGHADLAIDLRPDLSAEQIAAKLRAVPTKQSLSSRLRKGAGLSPAAAALLREGGALPPDTDALARQIKAVKLRVTETAGLERAISTAGGISWDALDRRFMLHELPGVYACGEMLDWEAPTGGYLLQGCFATGWAAAGGVLAQLGSASAGEAAL